MTRRLHPVILALAFVAAGTLIRLQTNADDQKDSAQQFQKAADLTDIRSPGSAAFQLDAKVQAWGVNGPISGGYSLVWVSPSRWREELSFNGYSRIRVGGEERYWQQRSLDYEPVQISELSDAIDFASSLRAAKSPGKLKSRQESGRVLECAQIGKDSLSEEYCFEPALGVLVLEITHPAGELISIQYSDFRAFGEKRIPAKIQVTAPGGTPIADFSVTHLANVENTALSDLAPPNGASLWLICSNPQKPRIIKQVQPSYPLTEKTAHHAGEVVMYGIIAADGSVQNLTVLSAPSPGLRDSAVDAVSRWRYEPRRCGDTPTPTETFLKVIFALGSY